MTHQSLKCHKAAILLGGHSSRMGGKPKFLLKDGKGQSYLKRQIKALEKADRIYLSAADAAQLALIQNVYKDKDCYGLIDVVKDCGPLGGLYTVLQQLKDEDEWIFELADGIIGDNYPVPDRMLVNIEKLVNKYLLKELCGDIKFENNFDVF